MPWIHVRYYALEQGRKHIAERKEKVYDTSPAIVRTTFPSRSVYHAVLNTWPLFSSTAGRPQIYIPLALWFIHWLRGSFKHSPCFFHCKSLLFISIDLSFTTVRLQSEPIIRLDLSDSDLSIRWESTHSRVTSALRPNIELRVWNVISRKYMWELRVHTSLFRRAE